MSRYREFTSYRERMNEKILARDSQLVKRFFALDTQAYQDNVLDAKSKELLGLVASLVLRCDDCVSYHIGKSLEAGNSNDEIFEAMSIGLVVRGSIVIPHMRRAVELLEELIEPEA